MTFELLLFYVFATTLVGSALGVILARNPVYSVLFLVFAFINSAFLWMLLEAEFLALLLIVVYVGAVAVLFLFVVMMMDINIAEVQQGFTKYAPAGAILGLIVVIEIGLVMMSDEIKAKFAEPVVAKAADYSNTEHLGQVIYTEYIYPFELAAIILLVAIVVAVTLTMRKRPGLKVQDINQQVAVDAKDRVKIVSMEAEQ
ncbi:MAG: NADH-quinone oxidoreductase subunit J [Gammaproteobacteria bacterium]|nr:NADH-quinone oxidoreductase subunit J [Gammaproteobacteria bacterium]NNC97034.1 NADH-quinone oxidoreductase subunit J [Gammaproteobacteria bacterium]NNM13860.1 NADH-quinone oxidoreductase subunit J [Gammaproteobacteria bacterium]